MASLSTAAAVLNRSALSIIARRSTSSFSTVSAQYHDLISSRRPGTSAHRPTTTSHTRLINSRPFSSLPPTNNVNETGSFPPPVSLTAEAGLKAQDAMRLFIEHGIGRRALDKIADETRQVSLQLDVPDAPAGFDPSSLLLYYT
jgi:hypothetical protein